jgi:putative ABC transport system permease protein
MVGIISGLYPAFYLAATDSVRSALVRNGMGKSLFSFRKILVIFQMIISIGVIICTLVIDNQIKYVRSKNVGLNRENLLIVPLRDSLVYNHFNAFKSTLLQNPDLISVSSAWTVPPMGYGNLLYRVETERGMEEVNIISLWANYDFIKTTGITLLEGRDYDKDISSDFKSAFIINESLAKKMGWNEPIGKHLQQNFNNDGVPFYDGYVIGVIRDFNFESLHNMVKPMVLRLQSNDRGAALIRVSGKEMTKTMQYIQNTWHKFSEDFPSDFTFLDNNYAELYKKDQQQNMLIKVLSWISIIISCMGLLSIASYITKIRNKEIVIRKVYGAPVGRITLMLYREITLLVAVSAIISIPLAYWLTEKLLNNFAYKAGFSAGLALLTVTGVILLTIVIVSWHSIKASYSDPAKFLKTE